MMTILTQIAALTVLLATLLAVVGVIRHHARGSEPAELMLAAQLLGTGGVALLMLLAADGRVAGLLDVALVLALLAVVAAVAFTRVTGTPTDTQGEDSR